MFLRVPQQVCRREFSHFFQEFVLRLLPALDVIHHLARLLRQFPDVRREKRRGFGQRLKVAASGNHGTQTADELQPHSLLHFLRFAQQDSPNLSGAGNVCASTGIQVKVADVDPPQPLPPPRRTPPPPPPPGRRPASPTGSPPCVPQQPPHSPTAPPPQAPSDSPCPSPNRSCTTPRPCETTPSHSRTAFRTLPT